MPVTEYYAQLYSDLLRKLLSPPVVPPNGTGTILSSNDISDTSAY